MTTAVIITIHRRDLRRAINECVEEKGEGFVYRPVEQADVCEYTRGADGCGCLIGCALLRLGIPFEVLQALDQSGSASFDIAAEHLYNQGYRITQKAIDAGVRVQQSQDTHCTWGHAATRFDDE